MIRAYAAFARASGDRALLTTAVRAAAEAILRERRTPTGHLRQFVATAASARDHRMRAVAADDGPYLAAQAHFGFGLVALASATGDRRWIEEAEKLADASVRLLADRNEGGFFMSPPDGFATRRKPTYENAVMARFLIRVASLAHRDDLREKAEGAVRVANTGFPGTGEVLLATEEVLLGLVEVRVAGRRGDPEADALFGAAMRTHEPRAVVGYDDEGRYPHQRAALYACTLGACSKPSSDPARVAAVVAASARVPRGAACDPSSAPDFE